jgi:ferredoxin
MRLHIDLNRCIGSGSCEDIRPDIFEVGDDGVVHLVTDQFTEADRQDLLNAVHQCPTRALSLEG